MKQVLLIVAAIAAIAFFSGGFSGDSTAAPDAKSKIIHAITLTPIDTPAPAPAVKVKRADCTVCKGTGRVKTGDGLSTTECENCVAGQSFTVDVNVEVSKFTEEEQASGRTKDCTCEECKCEDCRCVEEPRVNGYQVAIGGGDLLSRIVPRRAAAATCADGSCGPATRSSAVSGNCASGSCATVSSSNRTYANSGRRFTPVRRVGSFIRNRPRLLRWRR